MIKCNFKNLERVNKTQARKIYNAGFSVLFIPHKMNPENDFFNMGIWENVDLLGQYETFEKLENTFSYYNCRPDTGKYIAFYVSTEKTMIHFEFVNGSNPYIFRGSVLECMEELKRWGKNYKITLLKQGFYKLEEVTLKNFIFKTTATMKQYNNKNWWIDGDIITEKRITADNIAAALLVYREQVDEQHYISISDDALKHKSPMYIDTTTGTKQVGYVITGKTEFQKDSGEWVTQYIDLWIDIISVIDTDFKEV